jgi:ribose transport system permease protein
MRRGPGPQRRGEPRQAGAVAGPGPLRAATRAVSASVGLYAGTLVALLLICAYLALTQPFFLGAANIFNVLSSNASLMLISIGMTFVILSAGFDLSVGSLLAASGLAFYLLLRAGAPEWLAVVATLAMGAAVGAFVNGVLIGRVGLNFFVVTLGTMSLITGLVQVITNGQTKTLAPTPVINAIGNGQVAGVPVPVLIMVVALVLAAACLRWTPIGRAIYAVGGNREAARLAGINVTAVLILVYGVSGFFAALAGLVDTGRLLAATPTVGSTIALSSAAAVLLGGTSFFGGIGGVAGTVVGVLLIGVLQNGLGLMGVSAFWQGVVTGLVLIAAVLLDRLKARRRS